MIGSYNIKENLKYGLNKYLDIKELEEGNDLKKLDGLFLDWIKRPKDIKNMPSDFLYQIKLVDYYTKKNIPIIIYDRFLSLTYKEYNWLKKFNVKFFEPAINNRKEFKYLPQWTEIPELDDIISKYNDKKERKYDFAYKGNLSIKSSGFKKYFINFMKLYPEHSIVYDSKTTKWEIDELNNHGIKNVNFNWKDVNFTVLIDNQKNYNIGYINQSFFDALHNGCMILLPLEHKMVHSIFYPNIINDIYLMKYYTESFKKDIKIALIYDIFQNISKLWPEFTLEYAVSKIKENFGG